MCYTKWLNAGIQVIGDVLDKKGHVLQKDNLEQKYGIDIDQMDYNSLMHCIPKKMLNIVKDKLCKVSLDVEIVLNINGKSIPVKQNYLQRYLLGIYTSNF